MYSIGKKFRNFHNNAKKQACIVFCHIFIAETSTQLDILIASSMCTKSSH